MNIICSEILLYSTRTQNSFQLQYSKRFKTVLLRKELLSTIIRLLKSWTFNQRESFLHLMLRKTNPTFSMIKI